MSLMDGLVAAGVLGAVLFVVIAKAAKDNPKLREWLAYLKPTKLIEKVPGSEIVSDKIEQTFEQKRSMM